MLFDKLLSLLVYPLGASLLLGVMGIVLGCINRRRSAFLSATASLVWLWLWSSPFMADAITRSLEDGFTHQAAETLPQMDIIVVFSGVMNPAQYGHAYPHLCEGADRVWHAARLYHAGKAPKILLSGGRGAWQSHEPSEAETMAHFLKDLGVPPEAIILEEKSCNTYENAIYSASIMRQLHMTRALLVTSAIHMRRSMAVMEKTGVDVVPVATDFEGINHNLHITMRCIPRARALHISSKALHEWIGMLVYRWRGWI